MLDVIPYNLDDIKVQLKQAAIEEFGISDAEYEGSNISQLINVLAYSNVINNTNMTFGVNESFLTQATNKSNIIKHSRQLGYINKRKISYQYKIEKRSTMWLTGKEDAFMVLKNTKDTIFMALESSIKKGK